MIIYEEISSLITIGLFHVMFNDEQLMIDVFKLLTVIERRIIFIVNYKLYVQIPNINSIDVLAILPVPTQLLALTLMI